MFTNTQDLPQSVCFEVSLFDFNDYPIPYWNPLGQ